MQLVASKVVGGSGLNIENQRQPEPAKLGASTFFTRLLNIESRWRVQEGDLLDFVASRIGPGNYATISDDSGRAR